MDVDEKPEDNKAAVDEDAEKSAKKAKKKERCDDNGNTATVS